MWSLQSFGENHAARKAARQSQQRALLENATVFRDITGPPASPKAAKAAGKALKKNRPPATTDPSGNPYSPIEQVSPGKNQKQRQSWQDKANKTRSMPRRPQP